MNDGWSLGAVQETVAAAVPDREFVVWRDRRLTYAEITERSRRLANYLLGRGVGLHRQRSELERWECGQDRIAICLYNCPEYIEALLGGWKARAAPFNVNYRYTGAELAELLRLAETRVLVYQPAFAEQLAHALASVPSVELLIEVGGSPEPVLPGAVPYEDALDNGSPERPEVEWSADDVYLAFTGGTTGRPKGVLWRQADIFVATMYGAEDLSEEHLARRAKKGSGRWLALPPLMHVAAQWTAFSAVATGGTVVLHRDTTRVDPADALDTAAAEEATMMTIVGDAYARRIIDELRRLPRELPSLHTIATGGAPTSSAVKQALLDLLPGVGIVDGYGASETGGMAFGANASSAFGAGAGACVLSADRSRQLQPGEDEVGWVARRGHVPLGYLDDREATEQTFPVVDGTRVAVPGDRARVNEDGTIRLLGRDSLVVNTGGEKVFVEEVEEALKRHPAVEDAVVCGRPSERWGQEVVAVVQLRPGASADGAELRASCADVLADYKLPRAFAFCDEIARSPAGKADYRWARAQSETAKMT